jgi:hypothetical protein
MGYMRWSMSSLGMLSQVIWWKVVNILHPIHGPLTLLVLVVKSLQARCIHHFGEVCNMIFIRFIVICALVPMMISGKENMLKLFPLLVYKQVHMYVYEATFVWHGSGKTTWCDYCVMSCKLQWCVKDDASIALQLCWWVGDVLLTTPFRTLAHSDDDRSSMCLAHSSKGTDLMFPWIKFLNAFNKAVLVRIEADQACVF